jgi:hypothetical protein
MENSKTKIISINPHYMYTYAYTNTAYVLQKILVYFQ